MRNFILFTAILLGVCFYSSSAQAQISPLGTSCATTDTTVIDADQQDFTGGSIRHGAWRRTSCIQICTSIVEGDTTCAVLDLKNYNGIPDKMEFYLTENGSTCTGDPTLTVTTSAQSDGTPAFSPDTGAVTVKESAPATSLVLKDGVILHRYLVLALSDVAGCVADDDVNIWMMTYNRKDIE